MKLVLCMAIVALCSYIGRLLSKKTAQRVQMVREYQSALIQVFDCVAGRNLPIVIALESCGSNTLRPFFIECAQQLKESPTAGLIRIWDDVIHAAALDLEGLKKEDIAVISDGGRAVAALCANPTEKQAAVYLRQLDKHISDVETEKQKKCKLYSSGGVLAGLMIALLVI